MPAAANRSRTFPNPLFRAERVAFAFRLCVARKPSADELAVLLTLLEKHRKRFAENEVGAAEAAGGKSADVVERAAFALVARVLLNLDETITKE